MVRYPKKNSLYQPVDPSSLVKSVPPLEPKIPAVALAPSLQSSGGKPKQVDDMQVQQLNEHIRILEEKLKAIETSVAVTQRPSNIPLQQKLTFLSVLKKYWAVLIMLLLTYPISLGYNRWMHPSYTATMGFFVSTTDIKMLNINVLIPKEAQENILLSDLTIGKAWSRAAHWPDLIGKQPWIVRPIAWAYQKRITFEKHPSAAGFVVNVRENKMERARGFAMAITDVFKERYIQERGARLRSALSNIDGQMIDLHKRLEKIITQLGVYKPQEQCVIVSAGIKKNLDRITTERALELEEDYARMKIQSQAFPLLELKEKKGFDPIIFYGLLSRLTDMELKKYLLGKDEGLTYEGGLKPTKAGIASLINAYTSGDASLDANLLIKAAFIRTRVDALDALLNKRYGSLSSFSGRMGEYAGLKAEFEKRHVALENLNNIKEQMNRTLRGDLSAEVVIDMPVIVIKK